MKTAKDLTREQLEQIVDTAQVNFWMSDDGYGNPTWDADTEWDWERVEEIAGALIGAGLRPEYESEETKERQYR